MKPGLAVLPLEVWADVFLSSWFTRQELAQLANGIKNRNFNNKLQKLLHDCGKQSLHYLKIYKRTPKEGENPQREACLSVARVDRDFPETDMPENIKTFKHLEINHFDDEVLGFHNKIKSLFTNVYLDVRMQKEGDENVRILLGHFLPMLGGIRAIHCANCLELLKSEFPETLARAKELDLFSADPASITAYLNWLNTPLQDHGPRFLIIRVYPDETGTFVAAMVDTVRENFREATTPATFAIFIYHMLQRGENEQPPEDFNDGNATTNEQLAVRNASFSRMQGNIRYVEILRHPTGEEANIREWLKQRAYWEKKYSKGKYDEAEQVITIVPNPKYPALTLTIGQITEKKAEAVNQDGNGSVAGPSTSAKI